MVMTIRGSEVNDFLRCRLRWNYGWVEELESVYANDKTLFGNMMHKFLEVWYMGSDFKAAVGAGLALFDHADLSTMEQTAIDDLLTLYEKVTENYVNHYMSKEYEQTLATEFEFAVPIASGMIYTGTIDRVFEHAGRVYFEDYKTTSSVEKYDKNSDLDRQISRYWWALQQLANGKGKVRRNDSEPWAPVKKHPVGKALQGVNIAGFYYNIILKDYPVPPRKLKDGSLSKDKSQKTTAALYMKALRDEGLATGINGNLVTDQAYFDFLSYLNDHPREFFRRLPVLRTQQEIDLSIAELIATARDMRKARTNLKKPYTPMTTPIYRNPTTDCSWDCAFKEVCKATLDGSDAEFLKSTLLRKKVN